MLSVEEFLDLNGPLGYERYRKDVLTSLAVQEQLLWYNTYETIYKFTSEFLRSIADGGKLVMFGNGGSAADCDHIVGEFRNRFWYDRKTVNAISLSDSIATITAIGNDFSFDDIFARQLEGILELNDSVIALSTSGKSKNVIEAGKCLSDYFPNTNSLLITGLAKPIEGFKYHIQIPIEPNKFTTARIQESSMFLLHSVCNIFDSLCELAVNYASSQLQQEE